MTIPRLWGSMVAAATAAMAVAMAAAMAAATATFVKSLLFSLLVDLEVARLIQNVWLGKTFRQSGSVRGSKSKEGKIVNATFIYTIRYLT